MFRAVFEALTQRVTALEEQKLHLTEELCRQDKLHAERQQALLATVEALEERAFNLEQTIDHLRCRNAIVDSPALSSSATVMCSIPASTVDVQASADSDDQISLLPTCNAQAGSERDATEPPLSSSDTSLKPVAKDARAGVPPPGSVPTRVAEDEVAEPIAIGSACDLLEGKSEPAESVTWAAQVVAGMDNPSDVPPPTPVREHAVADGFTLVGKDGKPARRDRRMVSLDVVEALAA